jgi:hypothetical protein
VTSTSERGRAADLRRSQARIRLLIAVRRAERQTVAPTRREETAQSPPTSMPRRTSPTAQPRTTPPRPGRSQLHPKEDSSSPFPNVRSMRCALVDDSHRYRAAKARKNHAGTSPITRASGTPGKSCLHGLHATSDCRRTPTMGLSAMRGSPATDHRFRFPVPGTAVFQLTRRASASCGSDCVPTLQPGWAVSPSAGSKEGYRDKDGEREARALPLTG